MQLEGVPGGGATRDKGCSRAPCSLGPSRVADAVRVNSIYLPAISRFQSTNAGVISADRTLKPQVSREFRDGRY